MQTQEISPEKLNKIIQEKDKRIAELEQQIQWIMSQMRLAKHKQFGASSEQTDPAQLSIFNEAEANYTAIAPEPDLAEVKAHYRKRTRLTTDKLPKDIPVEVIEHELPDKERVCPDCGNDLHKMGKEIREELKIIPAKAVIVRHVQNVYSCRKCESSAESVAVIKAVMPQPVIKGGFAAPETIAHIAVQKFMMASPLNRQEQEWKQNGILLSRQTMSNWLIRACEDWLEPIYEEMKFRLCEHKVLHADETTLQVLREPGKPARSNSYMWLYRTSGEAKSQIVIYEYQPNRKYMHPDRFLEKFEGYLHADGYDGYHDLPEDRILVVGCMAHLRRKFHEALIGMPKDTRIGSMPEKGLEYCDRLFRIEKDLTKLSAEERHNARQKLSKPLFEEMYTWISGLIVLPKSLLGQAKYYALSQRKYLQRYLLDGRLEISNNRAERSIKPFVIGRKNWMFSNTPNGARTGAIYYSLIVSARENGLNPFEYLSWIFTNAPDLGRDGFKSRVGEFLPGSKELPEKVFTPKPQDAEPDTNVWDED